MRSIYELSWGETSFAKKLQLFFKSRKRERQKMRSTDVMEQVRGYSALSSTYYSIAGTAVAQFKAIFKPRPRWLIWLAPVRLLWFICTWLSLGAWCYWRMLKISNQVVRLMGYQYMSAEQCDIRQSILRRRGQYYEAKRCIHEALAKNPRKAHTRGLLHVGLADICKKENKPFKAEAEIHEALKAAKEVEEEDPRQAARIYRHCADISDWFEGADSLGCESFLGAKLRLKAKRLADDADAKDQLLKIN